jgi:predicted amidophosphoribosyltransferase
MLNWLFGLKCPDCGERITEENEYCPGCGVNLNDSNSNVSKIHSDQNFENAGANLEDAWKSLQAPSQRKQQKNWRCS